MIAFLSLDLSARTVGQVTQGRIVQLEAIIHALALDDDSLDPGQLRTTPVSSKRGSPETRAGLAAALSAAPQADCLVIDLGQNANHLCDEPFLILLTELLEAEAPRYALIVLLLPFKLFASDPARPDYTSTLRFHKTTCSKLIVVDSHLSGRVFPDGNNLLALRADAHAESLVRAKGRPTDEIRERLVRRLGHFKSSSKHCRTVSYAVRGADAALRRLFAEQLDAVDARTIVYDTRQNPWMRAAVASYCTDRGLQQIAIQSLPGVLRSGAMLAEPVALVLDVMSTGETARRAISEIESHLGNPGVLHVAAVLGNRLSLSVQGQEKLVRPFIELPMKVTPKDKCEQCQLDIPYQDERAADRATTLREYDFWTLLTSVSWRGEVDPPVDTGLAYDRVPDYEAVLEAAGDWVAYLMANRLREVRGYWGLVHPDQVESSALCRRIRGELQNLDVPIIAIPDDLISAIRMDAPEWRSRMDRSTELWRTNLNLLRNAGGGAVAVDIFTGSGATFRAVQALLAYAQVPVHLCFPMIERNPDATARSGVAHDAVYTWWGPRRTRTQ